MKLLMCLLTLLVNLNCTSMLQVPKYELVDMYDKTHLYKERVKELNKSWVTHYCQRHYEWETIKIRYTKNGVKYLVVMDDLTKGKVK